MSDRLIYAMSAVEHLFLHDENEPIQQGVGNRMAFLIKKEPDARKQVVSSFKCAYGLRSRQVHHLAGVENEVALQDFYLHLNTTLRIVIANMKKFKKYNDFLDIIDRIKYT
jgi:hydroxypyruvate isomerase